AGVGEQVVAAAALRPAELAEATVGEGIEAAKKRRDEFGRVDGAEPCSLCGQRINEVHAAEERVRLADALTEAEREAATYRAAVEIARERKKLADTQLADVQARLAAAATAVRTATTARDHAAKQVNDAAGRFQRTASRLPEPFRGRVGRVEQDDFPAAADLAGVQRLAEAVQRLTTEHKQYQKDRQTRDRLTARQEATRQSLDRLGDQPSPDALAAERDELQADLNRLRQSRSDADAARRKAEAEEKRLSAGLKQVEAEATRVKVELAGAEAARTAAEH